MSDPRYVVNDRYVVANGSTPAITIPLDFRVVLGIRPGMYCNLTLQRDSSLLVEQIEQIEDSTGGRMWRTVKRDLGEGYPVRQHLTPIVVQEAKKIVRNGPKSPAFTVNNHIAEKIMMKVHDPIIATLCRDGSMVFQLAEIVRTSNTTRITPVVRELSKPTAPYIPVIPQGLSLRRRSVPKQANGG